MIDKNTRVHRRLDREAAPQRYCSMGGGGGGGSSTSEANTTQQSYDQRVVGGNYSTNISANNSTVYALDANAVHQAFGFARDVYKDSIAGIVQSADNVADAYSTAKAGEQKVLVGVGMVIVGVVAVAALKGKV